MYFVPVNKSTNILVISKHAENNGITLGKHDHTV